MFPGHSLPLVLCHQEGGTTLGRGESVLSPEARRGRPDARWLTVGQGHHSSWFLEVCVTISLFGTRRIQPWQIQGRKPTTQLAVETETPLCDNRPPGQQCWVN